MGKCLWIRYNDSKRKPSLKDNNDHLKEACLASMGNSYWTCFDIPSNAFKCKVNSIYKIRYLWLHLLATIYVGEQLILLELRKYHFDKKRGNYHRM